MFVEIKYEKSMEKSVRDLIDCTFADEFEGAFGEFFTSKGFSDWS